MAESLRLEDWNIVRPAVFTAGALWVSVVFKELGSTGEVDSDATVLARLALKGEAVTYGAGLDQVLVNVPDVRFHLYDAARTQSVFTTFLVQPLVLDQPVQQILHLFLLHLLGLEAVGAVENISGAGSSLLRIHNQVHRFSEELQLVVRVIGRHSGYVRLRHVHQSIVLVPVVLTHPFPDVHEHRLQLRVDDTDKLIQLGRHALVPAEMQIQSVRFGGLHNSIAHHGLQKPAVTVCHLSGHASEYEPSGRSALQLLRSY